MASSIASVIGKILGYWQRICFAHFRWKVFALAGNTSALTAIGTVVISGTKAAITAGVNAASVLIELEPTSSLAIRLAAVGAAAGTRTIRITGIAESEGLVSPETPAFLGDHLGDFIFTLGSTVLVHSSSNTLGADACAISGQWYGLADGYQIITNAVNGGSAQLVLDRMNYGALLIEVTGGDAGATLILAREL